jgi:hypothetical protein
MNSARKKLRHYAIDPLEAIYFHVWGVSVTNNNGFWIGWLNLLVFLYNYNHLWQLTINGCLQLVPFVTGPRVSSLPLRRITVHTLNCLERRLSDESSRSCLHGSLYRLARIHGNRLSLTRIPGNCFVATKTCLQKRLLLSNRGPTVDRVTSGMCLSKRWLANGHIASQYVSMVENSKKLTP